LFKSKSTNLSNISLLIDNLFSLNFSLNFSFNIELLKVFNTEVSTDILWLSYFLYLLGAVRNSLVGLPLSLIALTFSLFSLFSFLRSFSIFLKMFSLLFEVLEILFASLFKFCLIFGLAVV